MFAGKEKLPHLRVRAVSNYINFYATLNIMPMWMFRLASSLFQNTPGQSALAVVQFGIFFQKMTTNIDVSDLQHHHNPLRVFRVYIPPIHAPKPPSSYPTQKRWKTSGHKSRNHP